MAQFRLLSGPFAGEVVPEKAILPRQFRDLDPSLQRQVLAFGRHKHGSMQVPLNQLVVEYEMSWDSEEV